MGGRAETQGGTQTVRALSPRVRRWLPLWCLLAAAAFVANLVAGNWLSVAGVLVAGLGPVVVSLPRVTIDGSGIEVREILRRERIAWPELDAVTLHWSWSGSSPTFELRRRDGATRSASAFGNLARHPRQPEREALLERLRREAHAHGFALYVREPTVQRA
jgi:hypothetical protein